jgi:hypothetical protein
MPLECLEKAPHIGKTAAIEDCLARAKTLVSENR